MTQLFWVQRISRSLASFGRHLGLFEIFVCADMGRSMLRRYADLWWRDEPSDENGEPRAETLEGDI
jgi:hypothetical protein